MERKLGSVRRRAQADEVEVESTSKLPRRCFGRWLEARFLELCEDEEIDRVLRPVGVLHRGYRWALQGLKSPVLLIDVLGGENTRDAQ